MHLYMQPILLNNLCVFIKFIKLKKINRKETNKHMCLNQMTKKLRDLKEQAISFPKVEFVEN